MRRLLVIATLVLLSACLQNAAMSDPPPVAGFVTDVDAFQKFIATRPTPEQFRTSYRDVTLVLPGQIASKEMRMNNSRYFAKLDDEGRIVGGRFM